MAVRTVLYGSLLQDYDLEENNQGALSFVDKFQKLGYANKISWEKCAPKYALYKLLSDSEKKKSLILYLHKDGSQFSKKFFLYTAEDGLQNTLEDNFLILGWDIGEECYREILINSLSEFDHLLSCINNISEEEPSAIFINFQDNDFRICSILRRLNEIADFESCLNRSIQNSPDETTKSAENNGITLSYEEFQQRMFDGLGNRDYDCYESDQLKYLKDKIAFAFFGPSSEESGYNARQNEQTDKMYEKILEENNDCAEFENQVVMTVVFNCLVSLESSDSEKSTIYSPVPVFILRKCRGSDRPCRIVIDHTGRVYKCWQDYLEDNDFCECLMVYPKDGRYEGDENGRVKLEKLESPACGVGKKILKVVDVTGSIVGLGSSGVLAVTAIPVISVTPAAPFIAIGALITGGVVGVYSIVRSICTLVDRGIHNESLNPIESEPRSAYLGIIGGATGIAAGGTNLLISKLAAGGMTIGMAGRVAVNTINVANIGVNGVAIGNSAVEITMRWWIDDETPSTLTLLQLSASILFFGHAICTFRTAGTIIEESQTSVIEDFKARLRSNRHRKMFEKLKLQTYRGNMRNMEQGRAEVISVIKNIEANKDEVFAFLTRMNKKFNEMGMKFAAKGGQILLDGLPIDISKVGSLSRLDIFSFYADLSSRPNEIVRRSSVPNFDRNFPNFLDKVSLNVIINFLDQLFKCPSIEDKIILILGETMKFFETNYELERIFSILRKLDNSIVWMITNLILGFVQEIFLELEIKYGMNFSKSKSKLYFISKISDELLDALKNPSTKAKRFIEYSNQWMINAFMEYEREEERESNKPEKVQGKRKDCSKCSGYYFTR